MQTPVDSPHAGYTPPDIVLRAGDAHQYSAEEFPMDQSANEPPCPVQRDDQPTTLAPVQAAEEIVSAAWIRELMTAAADADTAVRAGFHMREQALAVLREALMSAEPRGIAEAQAALDVAVHDLADSIATRNGVQELLTRERTDRPWADWLRLSHQTAGHGEDR